MMIVGGMPIKTLIMQVKDGRFPLHLGLRLGGNCWTYLAGHNKVSF